MAKLKSKREPCPGCGASRGLGVDDEGGMHCFAGCGYGRKEKQDPDFMPVADNNFVAEFAYKDITARSITEAACRKFGYGLGRYNGKPCHVANWYDDAGTIVGQKLRLPDAGKFVTLGKVRDLYGKTRQRRGGKMIVVTEGELDCLAVSDVLENRWPVVSVPHGADSAKKYVKQDLEWLESFDKVVLCFDNDEAGAKATRECRELFAPGKCHVAALSRKDPCEYLMAGDRRSLVDVIWSAQRWTPAGILSGEQILRAALDRTITCVPGGWPWEPINAACSGLRYRELVTVTAGTGVGKSTFCRELAAHLLKSGETVGYLALEESPRTTALGIYSVHADTALITDYDPDPQVVRKAHEALAANLYLFDHFGSTDSDQLLSRIRFMVVGLGCRVIILDHISIVVSGLELDDERRAIDVTMTRLRELVEATGCLLVVVSHLKRPPGGGHEEGAVVSLSHLRGSAAIAQLSDMVIGLERNQQDSDEEARHQVLVRVLKNRFSGRTGIAGCLQYDGTKGRLLQAAERVEDEDSDF